MEWVRGETIGYGTFSTVSLTTPSKNSCELPPRMAMKSADSYGQDSLRNEKWVLDQVGDCPEIVRCFGDDRTIENGEELYSIFLEYASRGSLATQLKKSNVEGLPKSDVHRHTRSVLKGLHHIHSKGFAHCDIKLGNILMFDDGAVKIADFGLAKKTKGKREGLDGELTASGGFEIRGTPLYMAPESVNGNEYDSPADIWALGCAVVEMASGKTAWNFEEGSNFMSLLMRIGVGDELPRIPEGLSEDGKDFLTKCFVRDPRKRWTAEMLLRHPFVTVDLDQDNQKEVTVPSIKEDAPTSPRCPFDFPDWVSVLPDSPAPVSLSNSPEERVKSLATEETPDWSVTGSWVTVR